MAKPVLRLVDEVPGNAARLDLTTLHSRRGWRLVYREGSGMACPGCGLSAWHVGRTMAECSSCGVAMPIERRG